MIEFRRNDMCFDRVAKYSEVKSNLKPLYSTPIRNVNIFSSAIFDKFIKWQNVYRDAFTMYFLLLDFARLLTNESHLTLCWIITCA